MISIHAPREGCDDARDSGALEQDAFQSTHPVRGATRKPLSRGKSRSRFQSTHPVRGATTFQDNRWTSRNISIHAPREGCDQHGQPQHSPAYISIHAPREGCDL